MWIRQFTLIFAVVFVCVCSWASAQDKDQAQPGTLETKKSLRRGLRFEISFSSAVSPAAIDGRLLLLISKPGNFEIPGSELADPDLFTTFKHPNDFFGTFPNSIEPRFQISDGLATQQMFGVDVEGLAPGAPAIIDRAVLGYPLASVDQISAGEYDVQALINRYETFHRADGHVVRLAMDRGEGQKWNLKPGNLYSKPVRVHLDPSAKDPVRIELTEKIPVVREPEDTKYIKHVQIESQLLTRFWGRPMSLGAIVLLPEGWETHPNTRYPLLIHHWHFRPDFGLPVQFVTSAPHAGTKSYEQSAAEYGYKFYQDWISGRLPRVIIVLLQHANPYFDDSYAVNSANVGPYGDAITQELIPYLEQKFHAIGQPWARAMFGFSTGGWETAAMQIFYPDYFNGAWASCPDPLDFRAVQLVNIYEDENAFWLSGPFLRIPRPAERRTDGAMVDTMDAQDRHELVLGTHGRSGEQWNIWQAVFSPVGPDGYPLPIWDPRTGVIDHRVAEYWREHYDLRYILQRDWKTLGPKLVGKLHFTVGTRDNFWLDNGVRFMQRFLESTKDPHYSGDFNYGPHLPHCYFGDPAVPVTTDQLVYQDRVIKKAVAWMEKSAPPGADLSSWKY
jgi:Putative esterase